MTDRGLRYRANASPPPGPRLCHYCGSKRNVEVEHVDGFEEHTEPPNLTWACRSCNTRKGVAFRNAGIGRRTRQFNPADHFSGAAAGLAGRRAGELARKRGRVPFGAFDSWLRDHLVNLQAEPTAAAVKQWRQAWRTGFSQRNPAGAHNLAQWTNAVLALKGQGGTMSLQDAISMVHATPHGKRSEFASEIWRRRKKHAAESEVPF